MSFAIWIGQKSPRFIAHILSHSFDFELFGLLVCNDKITFGQWHRWEFLALLSFPRIYAHLCSRFCGRWKRKLVWHSFHGWNEWKNNALKVTYARIPLGKQCWACECEKRSVIGSEWYEGVGKSINVIFNIHIKRRLFQSSITGIVIFVDSNPSHGRQHRKHYDWHDIQTEANQHMNDYTDCAEYFFCFFGE